MPFNFKKKPLVYVSDTLTSTKRVWVNCTTSMLYKQGEASALLKSQFYALDCISCWGGRDKVDEQCSDGSLTSSWEVPAEFVPAMQHMIMKFKWEEENFFLKADKS
jgi:hypothetical protein